MLTHGDTYSLRGVTTRTSSRPEQPAVRGSKVDAQVAALSERISHLETTIHQLETTLTELEEQQRELRQVSSVHVARSLPDPLEFRTLPNTNTRWIPGSTPRSGAVLRALRSETAASQGSVSQF